MQPWTPKTMQGMLACAPRRLLRGWAIKRAPFCWQTGFASMEASVTEKAAAAGGVGVTPAESHPPAKKRKSQADTPIQGGKRAALVRSGFERGVGKPRTELPVMAGVNDLGSGTTLAFHPQAFKDLGPGMLQLLEAEGSWQQQEISVHGRKVMQPRLICYMADSPQLSYTYSRTRQEALPWTPTVRVIKERVEGLAGTAFNSCLLNLYRDGQDSLSWHSDHEKPYGHMPKIGSVSFGLARDFMIRKNDDHSRTYKATLGGCGDVLIMAGNCQRDWQHSVPKRANCQGVRINLTFRKIVTPE